MNNLIYEHLSQRKIVLDQMLFDENLHRSVENVIDVCIKCFKDSKKIMLAGNGGSAGDAQHMAGELVSKFMFNRPGLSAIALTSNSSIVTAIGNDFGYEQIFSRQLEALGQAGDVFVGYSTSGLSKNILTGFEIAKKNGLITIGFTGRGDNPMIKLCDHLIQVPSDETPKIQEGHLILGHIICEQIEKIMFGDLA